MLETDTVLRSYSLPTMFTFSWLEPVLFNVRWGGALKEIMPVRDVTEALILKMQSRLMQVT